MHRTTCSLFRRDNEVKREGWHAQEEFFDVQVSRGVQVSENRLPARAYSAATMRPTFRPTGSVARPPSHLISLQNSWVRRSPSAPSRLRRLRINWRRHVAVRDTNRTVLRAQAASLARTMLIAMTRYLFVARKIARRVPRRHLPRHRSRSPCAWNVRGEPRRRRSSCSRVAGSCRQALIDVH